MSDTNKPFNPWTSTKFDVNPWSDGSYEVTCKDSPLSALVEKKQNEITYMIETESDSEVHYVPINPDDFLSLVTFCKSLMKELSK